MFIRQATASLLKRLRSSSKYGYSFFQRATTHTPSCNRIYSSHCSLEHFQGQPRSFTWILLYGQAALIVGGGYAPVIAEGMSSVNSENDASGSSSIGLQQVEDGSIISNEHTIKWRIYTDNGKDYFMQGKSKEAERFFISALEEAKKGFGERDPHVASACNNLAELYRVRKAYDKSEPLYLEAINILKESFGPDDVRVGAAFHNLGQFYIVQRKLEEAQVCYERALKIKGRVLGHGHADYADTMFHLGMVSYLQGKMEDAEFLIQDSIRILEEGGQGETYSCTRKLRYLAQIYSKSTNRLQMAENVQRKILHILELTKGWNSMDTVIAAESLSRILQSMGKLREAQEILERCLDARRLLLPEDHIQIGANMLALANVELLSSKQTRELATSEATSKLDRAKELLKSSIRIARGVVEGAKQKKNVRAYERCIERDEQTALLILLQSLKALALVEMAVQEAQDKKEALPAHEAESALRECTCVFKQYGVKTSASASIEVNREYLSCLKHLVNLITDTMPKNAECPQRAEIKELNDEIKLVEAEVSSHQTRKI